MFEISLTTAKGAEETTLANFKKAFPQIEVTEHKTRSGNNKNTYIHLKLTPKGNTITAKGGRPSKLTAEQMTELKKQLAQPNCNKSRLAKEYGITYATVLKISKNI